MDVTVWVDPPRPALSNPPFPLPPTSTRPHLNTNNKKEFCAGAPPPAESYTLAHSKKALLDLGLIEESEGGQWRPHRANKITFPSLTVAWELRQFLWESISVVRVCRPV